ncbi:MAG: ABC transporter permease [Chloroflexi bacterium]|nr:ABC transporter permease [Chloroflexota bacterium]
MEPLMAVVRKNRSLGTVLLLAPGILWMVLFLVVPVVLVIYFSFWTQTATTIKPILTLKNWETFVNSTVYITVIWNTVRVWLIVLAATIILAFPVAFFISFVLENQREKMIILLACIIPFWTSFLIRVVAWRPMLGNEGALNIVLTSTGIIKEPLSGLLYSELGMIIGMVQIYVVFMVGPLSMSLQRIDQRLIEAARDLGAGPLRTFKDIILPLSLPGLITGSIFVSVMALGEFATSAALSGKKVNLLGNVIVNQVGALKWGFASVAGVVLTILMAIAITLLLRVADLRKQL